MGFILGLLIGAVIIYLVVKNGSKKQTTSGQEPFIESKKSFAEKMTEFQQKVDDLQKPMNDFKATLPGAAKRQRIEENRKNGIACCPKCGSTSITANKKGVGIGKAAVGAVVAGPIGLLAGGIGKNKITCTCLNCGHKFKPGKH